MSLQHKSSLLLVLVFALSISIEARAQNEAATFTAKNAIYLELGGSSGIYAINYNKIFYQKGKLKLNASVGFSIWPNEKIDSKTIWLPAVPLEISALYGKLNHHLELGMGVTSYLNTSFDFDSETFETTDKVVLR